MRELTVVVASASAAVSAEHDRRVPEREEEADAHRALAVLQQLAGRVVDRGDVVGVEGVAEAEGVGERAETGERRVGARVVEEQPPAEHVEEQDGAGEAAEPCPLGTRQRLAAPASSPACAPLDRDLDAPDVCLRHLPTLPGRPPLTRLVRNKDRTGSVE